MENSSSGPGPSLPNIICYGGNVTYSCFDDDLDSEFVTPGRWTTYDPDSGLATAIFFLVYMVIGLPCNLFIMVSMIWKKLYRQPAHILLLNLALNDFLMCATFIPINVISGFAGEFIFGSNDVTRCHVCQIGVIFVIFTNFNLHILPFLSLDRFLFFRFPFHYKKYVTIKTTVVAVVLLWIFCIAISLPPIFGFGEIRFTQSISTCTVYLLDSNGITDNIFYEVFAILEAFVFPIPLLIVTTMGMVKIVWKQLKKTYGMYDVEAMGGGKETEKRMRQQRSKKKLRIVKVYGAILISNLITWTPNIVNLSVIFAHCRRPVRIPHPFFVSNYIAFTASVVIHPVLQVWLIPEIRRSITAPCSSRTNHPPPPNMELSRTSVLGNAKSFLKRKLSTTKTANDSRNETSPNGLERNVSSKGLLGSKQSAAGLCVCCVRQPQEQAYVSNQLALESPSTIHRELHTNDTSLPSPNSPTPPFNPT